jgi:hypothetical protein
MKAMAMASRAVRLSLVWAAAFLTPVAGTPRIDCLCPDGHVKLFCLNFSLKPRPGCCDGNHGAGQHALYHSNHDQGRACCRQAGQPRPTPGGNGIAGTSCKKTLAEGDTQTVPPVTAASLDHAAAALALAAVPFLASPAVAAPGCLLSSPSSPLPPPTDRVIVFRHLVI